MADVYIISTELQLYAEHFKHNTYFLTLHFFVCERLKTTIKYITCIYFAFVSLLSARQRMAQLGKFEGNSCQQAE